MEFPRPLDEHFPEDAHERELPPCDVEHLDELLLRLKATHSSVRSSLLRHLTDKDGAYIVKLLDLFDISELDAEKPVLHRIFDIFYAMFELCDRTITELLLSDANFLSVVGVLGYNPGLIKEMDFRSDLEAGVGYKEVIPIPDHVVLDRVHMNYRIHVIKDNVLVRSLPDPTVILLDHMVNENNFHILSYISETEEYWQTMKKLVESRDKRTDGLGLLKEVLRLVRTTRSLDRLPPQQRRDGTFGPPPVFGELVENLFGDGSVFGAFASILGEAESLPKDVTLVVDILNGLVCYQGPDRLRAYLASEGKCVASPTSDKDRLVWKEGSSLFTALLVVFERFESTRVQLFSMLREIFRIPLGQDDKFLSVLYPNYMHWLLQPLKYTAVDNKSVLFDLHDSIMELLTFCTENHGYRVKYLFGRQPIATYVEQMLRSKNKLFVIHAVKFLKACAARAEAFFSRFLIQNDLLAAAFSNIQIGKPNTGAVSSAILELVAFIEKSNLTSLIEHIYTKFYETYKEECPIVFQAIRTRYVDHYIGAPEFEMETGGHDASVAATTTQFVNQTTIDAEEEMYWEKDTEPTDQFVSGPDRNGLSEEEVLCRTSPHALKLVEYEDDEEHDSSPGGASRDSDTNDQSAIESQPKAEEELKLPERHKAEEEPASFLGSGVLAHKKKSSKGSPKYKAMFKKISWNGASDKGLEHAAASAANGHDHSSVNGSQTSNDSVDRQAAVGHDEPSSEPTSTHSSGHDEASLIAKRKLELDAAQSAESLIKKTKTCSPVTSS